MGTSCYVVTCARCQQVVEPISSRGAVDLASGFEGLPLTVGLYTTAGAGAAAPHVQYLCCRCVSVLCALFCLRVVLPSRCSSATADKAATGGCV
jgi:hypothetical protein